MADFRLKVFQTVAKHLNFTRAANELFITQPAVTKHIQELEAEYDLRLFDRRGNKISLTRAGKIMLKYTEEISGRYSEMEFELGNIKNEFAGHLRLGASTTIAQYVIPPVLALFQRRFQNIGLSLVNANTEKIEDLLLNNDIDLGIVEGRSHRQDLRYTAFLEDELAGVVHSGSSLSKLNEISVDHLLKIPVILRERGSGTLEVIEHALRKAGIRLPDLRVLMYLGSTESIKSFLHFSDCMGFISTRAIEKEIVSGQLRIITVKNFRITRQFQFVQPKGQVSGLAGLFIRFAKHHYNLI